MPERTITQDGRALTDIVTGALAFRVQSAGSAMIRRGPSFDGRRAIRFLKIPTREAAMCCPFMFFYRCVVACVMLLMYLATPVYSISLPVEGSIKNSDETFTGTAEVHLTGGGTLVLETNRGVTCDGEFINETSQKGSGAVTCNDGRLGTFEFVATGLSGSGDGLIEKDHFVFHIGK